MSQKAQKNQNAKNVEDIYFLSPAQQGMLMLLLTRGLPPELYFEQMTATLRGRLDTGAWRRAWQAVVDRHPALRTLFLWEKRERPLQVVRRTVELPWREEDWSGAASGDGAGALGRESRDARFEDFLTADRERGFDLRQAPLMRCALIRTGPDEHRFVWSFHHLVLDGWSLTRVLAEAMALYRAEAAGEAPPVLPPAPPFRDYIGWLQSRGSSGAEDFWRRELAGFSEPTPLPFASSASASSAGPGQESRKGGRPGEISMYLDPEARRALEETARGAGLTLNTLAQGAWGVLLARATRRDDVVFGAVVSGRPPEIEGVENMVGLFINALPVRARLESGRPFLPWLRDLQAVQGEMREHEASQLEEIRAASDLPPRTALFESLLVFESYPVDPVAGGGDLPGLAVEDVHLAESTHYPVTLYVSPHFSGLGLRLAYDRSKISDAEAESLLGSYRALLAGLAERARSMGPEDVLGMPAARLPLLTAETAAAELSAGRGPERPRPPALLHELVAARALSRPDHPAVETPSEERLTYRRLHLRARGLALRLRELGVGPETVVAVAAERTLDLPAAMLGVLEAGGAYLPLDPGYPEERREYLLADSGARLVLASSGTREAFRASGLPVLALDELDWNALEAAAEAAGKNGERPSAAVDPANLAYLIYTSGSTGRPKGVGVPHAAIAHYAEDAAEGYGVSGDDRVLQMASVSFDTSAEEIYTALAAGATVVLRDDAMMSSHRGFLAAVERLGITVLDLPTAYWHELTAALAEGDGAPLLPKGVRTVILGGEEARADRLAQWWRITAGSDRPPRLFNSYGPTEATVVTTRVELLPGEAADRAAGAVPIGRPISNARAYVLDDSLTPVPAGVTGELFLGGRGLARGYLGRPAATAAAFVPDPLADRPGARLYRSGDLAVRLPGGAAGGRDPVFRDLVFRGRADHQVKIRGYRVELGEVEAALLAQPGVAGGAVVARGDLGGEGDDLRLVAYWVPADGTGASAAEPVTSTSLRAGMADLLPEPLVPSLFVEMEALPLSTAGKVDRRALPAPGPERPDLAVAYRAPRTPVEEVLAGLWGELLGVETVGVDDDFFELGGHSLLVARLAGRVRRALGVDLPMVAVFETPTVARLAHFIEHDMKEGAGAGLAGSTLPELPPVELRPPGSGPAPLSFPQERIWFLDRLSGGGNLAYNFNVTLWFDGPFSPPAFHRALTEIIRRHEIFRTSFPEVGGEPVQVVHPPFPAPLPAVDLSGLRPVDAEEVSEGITSGAMARPFDVAEYPLVRWVLMRLPHRKDGAEEGRPRHEVVQIEQHFVHDGWSWSVYIGELRALYRAYVAGEESPLPELSIQYSDFAAWQREVLAGETMDRLLDYWTDKLAGAPPALELPTDRPRPKRPSFSGEMDLHLIPQELYDRLRSFSRKRGFTLFMTMLATFYVLMYRYTGQSTLLLGTTHANRRTPEIEKLIGMIVNSLVLRGDVGGDPTFMELLGRVRETTLGAYAHQDMPLERLVQAIRPERQLARNPLFQVLFQFHDAAVPDLDFGEVDGRFLVRGNRTSKMDLAVIVIPRAEQRVGLGGDEGRDERAHLHWEYSTELFDPSTMHRMVRHFFHLLETVLEQAEGPISELSLLSAAEARQLAAWNEEAHRPRPPWPSLVEAVAERAAARPDAPAVVPVGGGGVRAEEGLTYGELIERAGRLAHLLREKGVGPESVVAVHLGRSPETVAALLGVLASGAAYLPLDPAFPAERRAFMLADSGARVVLTEEASGELPVSLAQDGSEHRAAGEWEVLRMEDAAGRTDLPATLPASLHDALSIAYVLYTSGSTGRPKGVAVPHEALLNLLSSVAEAPGLAEGESMLAVTTLSFDIAAVEMYLPLLVGGTVMLADAATVVSGRDLAAALAASGASLFQATPATWRMLLDAGWTPERSPGLRIVSTGEALPPDLAETLTAPGEAGLGTGEGREVWNLYGPTETTIFSTRDRVAHGEPVAIGRAVANTRLFVAAPHMELAPAGVPGELWIGGAGLARGYLGRPALTADRFRPDPFSRLPGRRIYATGDRVRRVVGQGDGDGPRDGRLMYLGRLDNQVKVRGFRVELGEVEAALAKLPGISRAAAAVREDSEGVARLVAYAVPERDASEEAPDPADLQSRLGKVLAPYMVPAVFVFLEAMPLTPSGKIDRKALPEPGGAAETAERPYVAPRNELESQLAAIWAEVLGLDRVGVLDSFFLLGGHSLSAGRAAARIRDRLGVDLPVTVLFDHPSVEEVARILEAELERREAAVRTEASALSDAELDALLGEMLAREES